MDKNYSPVSKPGQITEDTMQARMKLLIIPQLVAYAFVLLGGFGVFVKDIDPETSETLGTIQPYGLYLAVVGFVVAAVLSFIVAKRKREFDKLKAKSDERDS